MLKKYFFLLIVLCLFTLSSCDDKKDNPAEAKAEEDQPIAEAEAKEGQLIAEAKAKEGQLIAEAKAKEATIPEAKAKEATIPEAKAKEAAIPEATKKPEGEGDRSSVFSICERTEEVKQAILNKLKKTDCKTVTEQDLQAIFYLNLKSAGITKLKAGDFDNLISLKWLFLSSNALTSLPARIFSDLTSLKYVSLFNNNFFEEEKGRIKGELPTTVEVALELEE